MWGKMRYSADDWMYPKPLRDLSGWQLRCMDSGNMHHFVGADSSCISWGQGQFGELVYGPNGQKSFSVPKKVDILEGMHIFSVACGFAHSMVVVDRTNVADRLERLEVYDGKAVGKVSEELDTGTPVAEKPTKKIAAKKSENSKRKNSDSAPESEDEENNEENLNGQAEHGKKQGGEAVGKERGMSAGKSAVEKKGTGRGRGRPLSTPKDSPSAGGKGSGKRGRPKKM